MEITTAGLRAGKLPLERSGKGIEQIRAKHTTIVLASCITVTMELILPEGS